MLVRNNYRNQDDDTLTKISRSKSRNQMSIVTKNREKVVPNSVRKVAGMIGSTSSRFPSTTTTTNHTPNVPRPDLDLKNKLRIPNRRYGLFHAETIAI